MLAAAIAASIPLSLAGCASDGQTRHPGASGNPTTDLRNPELHSGARTTAVGQLWRQVEAGEADRSVARDTLKAVAWPTNNPEELRLEALRVLFADRQADDDSRALARLMLPHGGGSEDVTERLAMTAAERGWTECAPAIVRSYANYNISIDDDNRSERRALLAMHPGKTIPEIVYAVFLDPQTDPGPETIRFDDRTRADAWNLLARLDPSGELRAGLILDAPNVPVADSTRPMLAALRDALRDFRVVPITGDELQWVAKAHASKPQWWAESKAAVARLDSAPRLAFRHIEPVRWAAANRSAWLSATREELLAEIESRQQRGTLVERRADRTQDGRRRGERVKDWLDTLSWADALTIRVVEAAVEDTYVLSQIRQQAALDRDDSSTEYGGILEAVSTGGFDAVLFPPRPSQRVNDTTFVASQDMLNNSSASLAHYHLHAQRNNNDQYAGPSLGDLRYAARSGRTCVVFTTVGDDEVNVDVYGPDGSVIDLGVMSLSR